MNSKSMPAMVCRRVHSVHQRRVCRTTLSTRRSGACEHAHCALRIAHCAHACAPVQPLSRANSHDSGNGIRGVYEQPAEERYSGNKIVSNRVGGGGRLTRRRGGGRGILQRLYMSRQRKRDAPARTPDNVRRTHSRSTQTRSEAIPDRVKFIIRTHNTHKHQYNATTTQCTASTLDRRRTLVRTSYDHSARRAALTSPSPRK
jgi:hypothetical protein